MKALLNKAILNEIQLEIGNESSQARFPSTRCTSSGELLLAYSKAAYRLCIWTRDDATLRTQLSRVPNHDLDEQEFRLTDSAVFERVAHTVYVHSRMDEILVRILHRVGNGLLDSLRPSIGQPQDWNVAYSGPRLHAKKVFVSVSLQPPGLRLAAPQIRYNLNLTSDRYGKYKAEIDIAPEKISARSRAYWRIATPEAWHEKQWNAADLPHVTISTIRQIESFVRDRLLPVESVSASQQTRQAMLVLVPLRLAKAARQMREVAWSRELVDACLLGLSRQPVNPRNIVRQLFFQLLQLDLADPRHQSRAYAEYELLGLRLAGLRRVDDTLPYNPVLPYDRHCNGKSNLDSKLSRQDRKTYAWFLEQATLEQVADLMLSPEV